MLRLLPPLPVPPDGVLFGDATFRRLDSARLLLALPLPPDEIGRILPPDEIGLIFSRLLPARGGVM